MTSVKLPTTLRNLAGGERFIKADGHTVREVFAELGVRFPKLGAQLVSAEGAIPLFVNVFLEDEDIRYLDGLDSEVRDGSEITILPAVAGG